MKKIHREGKTRYRGQRNRKELRINRDREKRVRENKVEERRTIEKRRMKEGGMWTKKEGEKRRMKEVERVEMMRRKDRQKEKKGKTKR